SGIWRGWLINRQDELMRLLPNDEVLEGFSGRARRFCHGKCLEVNCGKQKTEVRTSDFCLLFSVYYIRTLHLFQLVNHPRNYIKPALPELGGGNVNACFFQNAGGRFGAAVR